MLVSYRLFDNHLNNQERSATSKFIRSLFSYLYTNWGRTMLLKYFKTNTLIPMHNIFFSFHNRIALPWVSWWHRLGLTPQASRSSHFSRFNHSLSSMLKVHEVAWWRWFEDGIDECYDSLGVTAMIPPSFGSWPTRRSSTKISRALVPHMNMHPAWSTYTP